MNRPFVAKVALAGVAMFSLAVAQSPSAPNPNPPSITLSPGTTLVAELTKGIDGRKAHVGDPVRAKIVQDVIVSGQIVVARGSKLLGRITAAKISSHNDPPCVLGVVFDEVALKHGEKLDTKAVLQALAPPISGPDPLASSPGSSYDGSKGLGVQQPVSGRDHGWIVSSKDGLDHTRDDALKKAADPNSYGHDVNTLHNGFLGSGNRGVFGIPGVSLKSGAGVSEPELISAKADIKLENGTQLVVAVLGSH